MPIRVPSPVGLALLLPLLTGCMTLIAPARQVPMPYEGRQLLGPERADGLLVLLPGVGDRADTFVEQGVLDAVAEHAPGFDVIASDAHFGYYYAEELVPRLAEDIIGPAHVAGYRQIWLLGISLGGMGATIYASQFPDHVDGVILMGPYLGDGTPVGRTLLEAEDLAAWDPARIEASSEYRRHLRDAWTWLQHQTAGEGDSVVMLAFGDQDGPGTLDDRLWDALPAEHRAVGEGGHTWTVWRPLIDEMLGRMHAEAAERQVALGPASDARQGGGGPTGGGGDPTPTFASN